MPLPPGFELDQEPAAPSLPEGFVLDTAAPVVQPKPEGGFFPAIARGMKETGSLLFDVAPGMIGKALGADEYAERQFQEAAKTQEEIRQKYAPAVPSYKDIKGVGDFVTYVTESVGEMIPSILPSLVTGGAAGIIGRGAVIAAREAAEQAVLNRVAREGAEAVANTAAREAIQKQALEAGIAAAKKTAMKYEATGAVLGSASQNVPDVYQNIREETGQDRLGTALMFGGFNALLDAAMPISLLAKARKAGIPNEAIVGEWYARAAKGAGKGFATESVTEGTQEASSAAAVSFVDQNKDFFTKENLEKFINAGLKGGLGGGVVSGATDVVMGKSPQNEQPSLANDIYQAQADILSRQELLKELRAQADEEGRNRLTADVLRELGIPKSKDENSLYQSLLDKDLNDPEEAGQVLVRLQEAADSPLLSEKQRDNALAAIKSIKGYISETVDVGQNVEPATGTSVPGADAGANLGPAGVQNTEPDGVVPPAPDAGVSDGGEGGVTPPITPPQTPQPNIQQPGVPPTEGVPQPDATPVEGKQPEVAQHAVSGYPVVPVPVSALTLSKDVPQFKMDANAEGVVKPLSGEFDFRGVAPIQVWERNDGTMEVISGRHRLDLARRSGVETIPAQIHREADGFDATKAAMLDAELNIRDNQGKVKDYVNYFKAAGLDRDAAQSRGLLDRQTGERAFAVATEGSDALVAAVRNDQIGDEAAHLIAITAPNDERLQAVGLKAIASDKSTKTAINMMQAVKALAKESDTTVDMFGFDDSALREAEDMAKIASAKQREIQTRLSAITGASKNPAVAKAEGIDIRDPEAVKRRIGELRQLRSQWDNWATSPELIGQIRAEMTAKPSLRQPEQATQTPETAPETPSTQELIAQQEAELKEALQKFEELLKRQASRFGLKDVAVRVATDLRNANGLYSKGLITMAHDAENPVRDLRHESIHALKELGFFTDAQWQALVRQANKTWINEFLKGRSVDGMPIQQGEQSRYDAYRALFEQQGMDAEAIEAAIAEEAIADAFGVFDARPASGMMRALIARLKNLFFAIREALGATPNAERIFQWIESGKAQEQTQGRTDAVAPQGATADEANASQGKGDERFSLRKPPSDPEFLKFFYGSASGSKRNASKIVDDDGMPKVMYTGTARDISTFKPKQAGAIFVSPDPKFTETYSIDQSPEWQAKNANEVLSPPEIRKALQMLRERVYKEYGKKTKAAKDLLDHITEVADFARNGGRYNLPYRFEGEVYDMWMQVFREVMPVGPNTMPVYVHAANPFDYELPSHREAVLYELAQDGRLRAKFSEGKTERWQIGEAIRAEYEPALKRGAWDIIEKPEVQAAIKRAMVKAGADRLPKNFDAFYVKEGGVKNLGVYKSSQLKSALGNVGTYGQRAPTEEEAARADMTVDEAKKAQEEGDIRFSIRSTKWTDQRIDELVDAYGYTDGRTYGFAAYVNPKDFINATTPNAEYAKSIAEEAGVLDKKALAEQKQTPFIEWDIEKNLVLGHEGRHRMAALADAGVQSAPVVLWVKDRYGSKKPDQYEPRNSETIKGQKFQTGVGRPLPVTSLVPLSYKYRAQLQKDFGGDADVKYSIRSSLPRHINMRIDQTTTVRDEKNFAQRMMEAITPKSWSSFRAQAINRYNRLSEVDRIALNQMGGAEFLADATAESAALTSDLASGVVAAAMGVYDKVGGAPVYKRHYTVYVTRTTPGGAVSTVQMGGKMSSRQAAEALARRVNGQVKENGYVSVSSFDNTIKGPLQIFKPLAEMKDPYIYQAYQTYAGILRGSKWVNNPNGGVVEKLFNDPNDMAVARELERRYPVFKTVHADWIKYNDQLVQFMVDTGVLSADKAEEFRRHGDYIPFYRQMDGEEIVGPKVFQSIARVQAPKKLKGSENPLGDFLENVVRNTQSAVQSGMKNIAARRAADVGQMVGIVQPVTATGRHAANSFYVFEDGKQVWYDSNDMLFIESIKSLGLSEVPWIGLLSAPSTVLRNLVTKDPSFMLANMLRDSLAAWTTTDLNITPVASTLNNFKDAILDRSPELRALQMAGVIGGYDYSRGTEEAARRFKTQLRREGKATTVGEKAARPVTWLWEGLEKATEASDAATRMEVYKKTLQQTGNEAEALFRALEVMNFNRKGSNPIIRILTAAIPFMNARIQGLDLLYRIGFAPTTEANATDRAKQIQRAFFVRGMTMMALSSMYWFLTHDDDEYKKQEQETRDNYWLVPSLGIKLPIPFEIGFLFKVLPERILENSFGGDTNKDFRDSMLRNMWNTFGVVPIPQLVLPAVEATLNKSFFTMRPIVGQGLEEASPQYQIGPGTSQMAILLAKALSSNSPESEGNALKFSPMKIDYLIRGYTGTLGQYAVQLFDSIYDMHADNPKPSLRPEQMPVIKRFLLDPEARGQVTQYYDLKNATSEATRTLNLLERDMNYKEWGEYYQQNMKLLAVKDHILDLEKTMKEYREAKNMIRAVPMDPDLKRDTLLQITKVENQVMSNIQLLRKNIQ